MPLNFFNRMGCEVNKKEAKRQVFFASGEKYLSFSFIMKLCPRSAGLKSGNIQAREPLFSKRQLLVDAKGQIRYPVPAVIGCCN